MNQTSRPSTRFTWGTASPHFWVETRAVHTSGGSVMWVSVSMARMRSKMRWVMACPLVIRSEQRREARCVGGAELAAQALCEPLDVERGAGRGRARAERERCVEIARDALDEREAALAQHRAERPLERVDRSDRVGDQHGAAGSQSERAAAAVAGVGAPAHVAERLELARGRVSGLATHAVDARDLVDPRALGSDVLEHRAVRHLEAG